MNTLSFSFPTQRYYRIAVSAFFFIQGICFASWASRIPDIKNKLQLTDGELGGVLLGLPLGQLTAMAMSGYLVSKLGSKTTLTIGSLIYPAVLVLIGSVANVWQLTAALFLFGVSGNLTNISVNTQAVGVERLYRRSIMASFHGIWSLAGFTGGLISTAMVSANWNPQQHFIIIYLLALGIMLSARRFVLPRDAAAKATKGPIFVKPDAAILRLGLIAFACMVCEGTMFDWSGIYFEKVLHVPKDLTRIGYVAFMCTMASGRLLADKWVTRFGVQNILKSSGIIILVGLMTAVIFPYLVPATIGFLMVGIGVSSVVPMTYSLAGKSKTMLPGVALAAVSSIGFLGFLLGPPIIGFIAEASSLRVSFAVIAILGLGTTVLAGRIKTG